MRPIGRNVRKGSNFPDSATGTVQYASTITVPRLTSLLYDTDEPNRSMAVASGSAITRYDKQS